jgi:cell division transport system permease protein
MRIRTVRHIIKDGFVNSYRNKLMSLASVIIVVASLIVFGFFILISFNLELNVSLWQEQPQMAVFCYTELDDTQIQRVEDSIKNNEMISEYQRVSKEENFQKAKEELGKGSDLLDGYDADTFMVSFVIKLKDPAYSDEVVKTLENTSGVEKVSYSQNTIDVISRIAYWIRLGSSVMVVIFLVVSIFIISNTIKLTVFARRKEINIMKYIGATDWFIRWPFVVEGVIISTIGAIIAFILSAYGYNMVQDSFSQDQFLAQSQLLQLIELKDIWSQLLLYYLAIGSVVGIIGSLLSIRRHLRV